MMKKTRLLLTFIALIQILIGCKSELGVRENTSSPLYVIVKLPMKWYVGDASCVPGEVKVTVQNVMQKDRRYEVVKKDFVNDKDTLVVEDVPEGIYDIYGRISYNIREKGPRGLRRLISFDLDDSSRQVRHYKDSKIKNTATLSPDADVSKFFSQSTFVLTELGLAAGGSGDQYLTITNNSHETLFADSLLITESALLNLEEQGTPTPQVTRDHFPAQAVFMIPGTGTSYPIQPGGSLRIVNRVGKTPDGAKADFEIIPAGAKDNPRIPNLECYVAGEGTGPYEFSRQGLRTIVLARMTMTKKDFMTKNKYTYHDPLDDTDKIGYKIAYDCLCDAVVLSIPVESGGATNVSISKSIVSGFSGWAKSKGDPVTGSPILRRKVSAKDGDRVFYLDSNNVSNDFEVATK